MKTVGSSLVLATDLCKHDLIFINGLHAERFTRLIYWANNDFEIPNTKEGKGFARILKPK